MNKHIIIVILLLAVMRVTHAGPLEFIKDWGKALMPEYWHSNDMVLPARTTKQKYKFFTAPSAVITSFKKRHGQQIIKETKVFLDERGLVDEKGNLLEATYKDGSVVNDPLGVGGFGCISGGGPRVTVLSKRYKVLIKDNKEQPYWGRFDAEGRLFVLDANGALIKDDKGLPFAERDEGYPGAWTKEYIFKVMYWDAQIDGSYAEIVRAWKLKNIEKTWCVLWGALIVGVAYELVKKGHAVYKKYKNKQTSISDKKIIT